MTGPTQRSGLLGAGIVVLGASLFGSLGILSKVAYGEGMVPFAFVTWRAAVGALVLWLFILVMRHPSGVRAELARLDRRGRGWLLLAIVLASLLNLASFLAFANTTVALALLAFYTYPAMVAAGSVMLGRERLDLARVAALLLALGGMAAVVLGGPTVTAPGRNDVLGMALALGAGLYQTGFVLTSHRYHELPADHVTGALLLGSAIMGAVITVVAVMVCWLGSQLSEIVYLMAS